MWFGELAMSSGCWSTIEDHEERASGSGHVGFLHELEHWIGGVIRHEDMRECARLQEKKKTVKKQ